jgi:hypothetical protein
MKMGLKAAEGDAVDWKWLRLESGRGLWSLP